MSTTHTDYVESAIAAAKNALDVIHELGTDTVVSQADSGNITTRATVRKLGEAKLVRDENGELPFPFDTSKIIPKDLAELLSEITSLGLKTKSAVRAKLEQAFKADEHVRDDDEKSLRKRYEALTLNGFLTKKLEKRLQYLGHNVLRYNEWNKSYGNNKWVIHIHDNGEIVAEHVCVTTAVKRNHPRTTSK